MVVKSSDIILEHFKKINRVSYNKSSAEKNKNLNLNILLKMEKNKFN